MMKTNSSVSRFKIWIFVATGLIIFSSSLSAAPCIPCGTWGSIKTCGTSQEMACCSCGKDIIVDGESIIIGSLRISIRLYNVSKENIIMDFINMLPSWTSEEECDCVKTLSEVD